MKKNSLSSQNLSSFPSPGAPNYREKSIRSQKGSSSERVPQKECSNRRRASVAGFTPPFLNSGRSFPSKWDEAERWICSPNSGYFNGRISNVQFQRRPKSKSGPIVPPAVAYYSNHSPTFPLLEGLATNKNLMAGSPFSTGVLAPDSVSVLNYDGDNNGVRYSCPTLSENGVLPLNSAPRWSELLYQPSPPSSQDDKDDGAKNEDAMKCLVLKCDKGTQMSSETENDSHLSPKSSNNSAMDPESHHSSKLEVRDVQVDSEATVIRRSKKRHATKISKKDWLHSKGFSESNVETQVSSWDLAESNVNISKLEREEAKIIAWENLQKAKAEAAIRKLEMKLEKKKSSSTDKILNKLRRAQMKAEKMRSSIPEQRSHLNWKVFSLPKYVQIWFPIKCFRCHARSSA